MGDLVLAMRPGWTHLATSPLRRARLQLSTRSSAKRACQPDGGLRFAGRSHDRIRADVVGAEKHDPRPPGMLLRRATTRDDDLQAPAIGGRSREGNPVAHPADSRTRTRRGILDQDPSVSFRPLAALHEKASALPYAVAAQARTDILHIQQLADGIRRRPRRLLVPSIGVRAASRCPFLVGDDSAAGTGWPQPSGPIRAARTAAETTWAPSEGNEPRQSCSRYSAARSVPAACRPRPPASPRRPRGRPKPPSCCR